MPDHILRFVKFNHLIFVRLIEHAAETILAEVCPSRHHESTTVVSDATMAFFNLIELLG